MVHTYLTIRGMRIRGAAIIREVKKINKKMAAHSGEMDDSLESMHSVT